MYIYILKSQANKKKNTSWIYADDNIASLLLCSLWLLLTPLIHSYTDFFFEPMVTKCLLSDIPASNTTMGGKCPCQLGALRYIFWGKEAQHTTTGKKGDSKWGSVWVIRRERWHGYGQRKPRPPTASAPHTDPEATLPRHLRSQCPSTRVSSQIDPFWCSRHIGPLSPKRMGCGWECLWVLQMNEVVPSVGHTPHWREMWFF